MSTKLVSRQDPHLNFRYEVMHATDIILDGVDDDGNYYKQESNKVTVILSLPELKNEIMFIGFFDRLSVAMLHINGITGVLEDMETDDYTMSGDAGRMLSLFASLNALAAAADVVSVSHSVGNEVSDICFGQVLRGLVYVTQRHHAGEIDDFVYLDYLNDLMGEDAYSAIEQIPPYVPSGWGLPDNSIPF